MDVMDPFGCVVHVVCVSKKTVQVAHFEAVDDSADILTNGTLDVCIYVLNVAYGSEQAEKAAEAAASGLGILEQVLIVSKLFWKSTRVSLNLTVANDHPTIELALLASNGLYLLLAWRVKLGSHGRLKLGLIESEARHISQGSVFQRCTVGFLALYQYSSQRFAQLTTTVATGPIPVLAVPCRDCGHCAPFSRNSKTKGRSCGRSVDMEVAEATTVLRTEARETILQLLELASSDDELPTRVESEVEDNDVDENIRSDRADPQDSNLGVDGDDSDDSDDDDDDSEALDRVLAASAPRMLHTASSSSDDLFGLALPSGGQPSAAPLLPSTPTSLHGSKQLVSIRSAEQDGTMVDDAVVDDSGEDAMSLTEATPLAVKPIDARNDGKSAAESIADACKYWNYIWHGAPRYAKSSLRRAKQIQLDRRLDDEIAALDSMERRLEERLAGLEYRGRCTVDQAEEEAFQAYLQVHPAGRSVLAQHEPLPDIALHHEMLSALLSHAGMPVQTDMSEHTDTVPDVPTAGELHLPELAALLPETHSGMNAAALEALLSQPHSVNDVGDHEHGMDHSTTLLSSPMLASDALELAPSTIVATTPSMHAPADDDEEELVL
ncbi:hypothetical protein THASP1DRAFT_24970 [Thamnocephalis sphaerospora]|uniref:Uncharacterized protein n=1 Tax=Thamnocephalis sphaerospora TaxID=78915 RepID=A0A4P9XN82_9FUNG|nr:hypothetical protein THASP1DRAFT_24970 [Thamnocephalis sphaerospora]|eukprot:RKP06770.1 hypothetical protein THASP1DRAFT_24970 [Thamnocephalis sphaerospora]